MRVYLRYDKYGLESGWTEPQWYVEDDGDVFAVPEEEVEVVKYCDLQ